MRSLILIVLATSLSIILVACGSAAPTTLAAPAPVTITMTTNPDPPAVGDVELQFTVMDTKGQPVVGANFDVIADHTDMGGMTMHGIATDQGNGRYAIKTNFSMAGKWKLTVQVRTDALDYKQDIDLQIK